MKVLISALAMAALVATIQINALTSAQQPAAVLAWFPKAFTSGCTIECKSMAEHGDLIKKFESARTADSPPSTAPSSRRRRPKTSPRSWRN